MGFEILDRLDFAVGGNQAADGSPFDGGGAYSYRIAARKNGNEYCRDDDACDQPVPASARRSLASRSIRIVGRGQLVFFQGSAGTTARINLSPGGPGKNTIQPSLVHC